MSFDRLPDELKPLRQWVVWRYEETDGERLTKVLYTVNGAHASVTDWSTWDSFETCCAAANAGAWSGVGFVFTDADDYCGVDLDEPKDGNGQPLTGDALAEVQARQIKVFQSFDSYTEYSPSGKGYHIICKAKLPTGRRRSSIEIYSSKRFFTMTGNVYHDVPIRDCQGVAEVLYNQMSAGVELYRYDGDAAQTYSDEQIIEQGLAAANGDKFQDLLTDGWTKHYTSQSEADFAFINIISFYTQNRVQITRIFRASPLGQRPKAKRGDYVNNMIERSFDRMLPPLDMSGLYNAMEQQKLEMAAAPDAVQSRTPAQPVDGVAAQGTVVSSAVPALTYPRGLVGDIARFIYSASPRPVDEIAIFAAIGLMAGICGRSWNVSGTGLNMYLLLLAPTGVGKEAVHTGIDRLVSAVARISPNGDIMTTPAIVKFIGPAEISSAQALQKALATQPCFVSIVGEFGLKIQALASAKAMANDILLKRALLSLYSKSGAGQTQGSIVYSDKEKNIGVVQSPALTICGESTPETFLAAVDEGMILDGLLPRFLMMEYTGIRKKLNPTHGDAQPSFALSEKLGALVVQSHSLMGQGHPVNVQFEPNAAKWADEFEDFCTAKINHANQDVVRHLWNRAHLKLLKLSALIAVGANPHQPIVTQDDIAWAWGVINADTTKLIGRFERGETGRVEETDNLKQMKDMFKVLAAFDDLTPDMQKSYQVSPNAHSLKMISHAYLSRRLISMASFRKDKAGATTAIKRTLAEFIEHGVVVKVGPQQVKGLLSTHGNYYMLSNRDFL